MRRNIDVTVLNILNFISWMKQRGQDSDKILKKVEMPQNTEDSHP